ncbi:MAG: SRPBCC domain-containing protein [Bacteroidota bacterium]
MIIENTISIHANPSIVWQYLTKPDLMKKWMGEPAMEIDIQTDWAIGKAITIKGFHHLPFENKGIVLQFEPNRVLQYSHLSSLSRLANTNENYTIITFNLQPNQSETLLTVKIENFPTETIFKHLNLYWRTTTVMIKKIVEAR